MLLEIGREGKPGKQLEWPGDRPLTLGRGRDVDCPIPDPLLSRRHCQLEKQGASILVADLGSANGTFVNSVQVTRSTLKTGDVLSFGSSWLRVIVGPEPPAPETTKPVAARPDADTLPATAPLPEIDGYKVKAEVGRGSFGTVYQAIRVEGGREVALKVLPTGPTTKPEVIARFLREIEATGQLSHANLVAVLGAGEGDGFAYLVMEYVAGETVAKRLTRVGRLDPLRALGFARQIASGLEHALARGYIHRDVKPENILITDNDVAKLCDFGLVKSLGASIEHGLTRPGQGFGSVAYMPPEQVKSAATADQRADVYSVGATLYHMLSGRRPFSGQVTKSLLRRVLDEMPEPILDYAPDAPPAAVRIVEKCLQKDPADRFQTPTELREAIDACIAMLETGIGPAVRLSPPPAAAQPLTPRVAPATTPAPASPPTPPPAPPAPAPAPAPAAAPPSFQRLKTEFGRPIFRDEEPPGNGDRAAEVPIPAEATAGESTLRPSAPLPPARPPGRGADGLADFALEVDGDPPSGAHPKAAAAPPPAAPSPAAPPPAPTTAKRDERSATTGEYPVARLDPAPDAAAAPAPAPAAEAPPPPAPPPSPAPTPTPAPAPPPPAPDPASPEASTTRGTTHPAGAPGFFRRLFRRLLGRA